MKRTHLKPVIYRLVLLVYMLAMYIFPNPFSFMTLNVFLAWLPIEFGGLFLHVHMKWRYFLGALWLLFFPNIPYLLTDLLHLSVLNIYRSGGLFQNVPQDWLLFFLLVMPIIGIVIVGMNQALQVTKQLPGKNKFSWLYLIVLAFLSAVAIYVGRFDRIHSIELIIHPRATLTALLGNWKFEKLQFVFIFVIIQLVIWLLVREITQKKKED